MLMLITNFMTIFYNNDKEAVSRSWRTSIKRSLNFIIFALPLAGLLVLSGCEEDPSTIGSGILPGGDLNSLVASDTFTLRTYTTYIDKVESYYVDTSGVINKPSSYYLGGDYSPYFGLTQAGFVTQIWLSQEWPKDHMTLDSMILNFHISSVQGSLPMGQEINVYEVDEFMTSDSVYYINRDVPIKQLLGTFSIEGVRNSDTVMSLHMPMSLINEIMRDTTKLYLAEDSTDFRNYFNGLYFEYPQTDNYHMVKVNLNGGYNTMTLYYTDTLSYSKQYTFLFNSKTISYNVFKHDFDAAEPGKKPQYINQEIQDTVSYIQGYNGVFTSLKMPGLEGLKDMMPIGINRARLYLPAYSNDVDFLEETFPSRLIARYRDEEGDSYITRDYQIDPAFADGQYYSLDDYYVINITAFVQDYLEGVITEPDLEIIFASYEGSHLILWGQGSDNPPRLEIVFTEM